MINSIRRNSETFPSAAAAAGESETYYEVAVGAAVTGATTDVADKTFDERPAFPTNRSTRPMRISRERLACCHRLYWSRIAPWSNHLTGFPSARGLRTEVRARFFFALIRRVSRGTYGQAARDRGPPWHPCRSGRMVLDRQDPAAPPQMFSRLRAALGSALPGSPLTMVGVVLGTPFISLIMLLSLWFGESPTDIPPWTHTLSGWSLLTPGSTSTSTRPRNPCASDRRWSASTERDETMEENWCVPC